MTKTIDVYASIDREQLVDRGEEEGLSDGALQLFRRFTKVPLELKVAEDGDVVGCRVTQAFPENGRSVVTCVYCGQEYPDGTPATKSKLLTDHIKVCEKHPMRAAEEAITKLRAALIGFMYTETTDELDAMERAICSLPGSEEDKAVSINALQALKDTWPEQKEIEDIKCPVCNGVGKIGIPGVHCQWCHGRGK